MEDEARGAADHWLPEAVLVAIGKVTVAAARLEHGAHMLLEVLWGEPRGQFSEVAKDVKGRLRLFGSIYDMADDAVDPMLDWIDRANETMRERHRLMHSAPFQMPTEDGWANVGVRIRDGESWDIRADDVEDLASRLRDLAVECMQAVLMLGEVIPERPRDLPP